MKIQLDKEILTNKFLNPVSRITEEATLIFGPTSVYSLVNDKEGNIILYSKLVINTGLQPNEEFKLNIKDIRKLIKVFECISSPIIDLDIDKNTSVLSYKSPEISFKLHLVTDTVIRRCQINLEKVNSLTYDTDFILNNDKLSEILRGSIFVTESNKVYFSQKDGIVYAEMTDKSTSDVDSITFAITEKINGLPLSTPLPFSLDILRLISSTKGDDITVKINNKFKIISFEIITPENELKYIIPALTK